MGTLTPNQVLFVLRSLGKETIYQFGGGRPGEDFTTSFLDDFNCPLGNLASKMAIEYQLDYDTTGNIILHNPPSIDTIRLQVENVGMRIPNMYRENSMSAMKYIETFGSLYLSFKSNTNLDNLDNLDNWMGLSGNTELLVNTPLLVGNDVYLNCFLDTHLRDLCTDFDLYKLFPFILSQANIFQNRKEIIDFITSTYQPSGQFWISFGFSNIILTHKNIEYKNFSSIQRLISQLDLIAQYQLAFLFRPKYVKFIYGIEVSNTVVQIMNEIYIYILKNIKRAESQVGQNMRFSEKFQDFNRELDN